MKNSLFIQIRNAFLYSILTFILISLVITVIGVRWQIRENEMQKSQIQENENILVMLEKRIINQNLDTLLSDITYLSNTLKLYESIDFNNVGTGSDQQEYKRLLEHWVYFADSKKIYTNIRYISKFGDELIKVNYDNSGSYLSPAEDLQYDNKAFFFMTPGSRADVIYISTIKLSVKNDRIVYPQKAYLTLSKTIYDTNGFVRGFLSLTYDADQMLSEFGNSSLTSYGDIMLLNDDGYWLQNKDPQKEFTFMFEDMQAVNFANENPDVWKRINDYTNGSYINDKGFYSFARIEPQNRHFYPAQSEQLSRIVSTDGNWFVVSFVPNHKGPGTVFIQNSLSVYLVTLERQKWILLITFILIFSVIFLLMVNQRSVKVIRRSSIDGLTGTYNRTAGLDRLQSVYEKMKNRFGKLSVCYIDIDGLKNVNDSFGHQIGDELIRSVTEVLKRNVREPDFIIRVGGDEFLIVLNESDEAESEEIWNRIADEYNQINSDEKRKFIISASHGIKEFRFAENEVIADVIRSADEIMYEEKKRMNKKGFVIKPDPSEGQSENETK